MKRKIKYLLTGFLGAPVVIIFLVWFLFFRLPSSYSAEPVAGQVVDAKTGKPIEKAIVVAIWDLEAGYGLDSSIITGYLHVDEVLTDREGFYSIDGWGPQERPGSSYTTARSPILAIFKDGYYPLTKKNSWWGPSDDRKYKHRQVHKSDWHMQTLKLEPFDGDWKKYSRYLTSFTVAFNSLFNIYFGAHRCDWLKIPRMVIALDKNKKLLKERKLPNLGLPILDQLIKSKECKVESMQQFIEAHK